MVGASDAYFPSQGNAGYDVENYTLSIKYRPATQMIYGGATITARATGYLSRFRLDLRRWLKVGSVTVAGQPARFSQLLLKVVITPRRPLTRGATFTVVIRYAGPGRNLTDPDGLSDGWIQTADGAFVADEPRGAPTWFPNNDTPLDKATYTITVVVPRGLVGMSSGGLVSVQQRPRTTAWTWRLTRPVASYLVMATIGRFRVLRGQTASGLPWISAVDVSYNASADEIVRLAPTILSYFSQMYGPYPFGTAGVIIDHANQVGYELETATRPEFDRIPNELVLAHELAHQWFGDTVTLARWRDIWLHEGFAEFSTWLWDEHRGGTTAAEHLAQLMQRPANAQVWDPPPGDPGDARHVFAPSVYERGAGALETLRLRLGDDMFFQILRGWVVQHRYGNADVQQFIDYAEFISGQDLHRLFYVWLFRPGKP